MLSNIKKYWLYIILGGLLLSGAGYYAYEKVWASPKPDVVPVAPLYVRVPAKVETKPGRLRRLEVETTATHLLWINPDDSKVDLLTLDSPKSVAFSSVDPGVYTIIVVGSDDNGNLVKAVCVVTVQGANPVPPGPNPNPNPIPPGPTPEPDTAFYKALKDSVQKDNDKANVQKAATLYHDLTKVVEDDQYKTLGDLYDVLRSKGRESLGDSLKSTRSTLKDEFTKTLPTDPNLKLDNVVREQISKKFSEAYKNLELLAR